MSSPKDDDDWTEDDDDLLRGRKGQDDDDFEVGDSMGALGESRHTDRPYDEAIEVGDSGKDACRTYLPSQCIHS